MAVLILNGQQLQAGIGESILTIARRSTDSAREIPSSCPGDGRCRECIVQIKGGQDGLTPFSPAEAFLSQRSDAEGLVFRLACQARIARDDARVLVETFRRKLDIATTGQPVPDALSPWIERHDGTVHCDGQPLVEHDGPMHGLAIDVGTTTVVIHAVDLESGETLAVRAFENPQRYGGSDVMHRISYDRDHPGQLHQTILAHINNILGTLPFEPGTILAIAVAGNPTMRDLLFGLDVQTLGQKPYVSQTQAALITDRRGTSRDQCTPGPDRCETAFDQCGTSPDRCGTSFNQSRTGLNQCGTGFQPVNLQASQAGRRPITAGSGTTAIRADAATLGLNVHANAQVYGLPLISHHVGADTAAVLATLPLADLTEPFMMIDIGTNTEVVAGHGGRLLAASCAAGPAFEGGRVACGMAACEGAITALRRVDGRWELTSIGDGPVRGLCGSGLVDILGELRASGEMDALGRFRDGATQVAVSERPTLVFTRADASELAQTKAAIGLGQVVLLRKLGLEPSQIGKFYLAGAFANKLNLASAQRVGLLMPVAEDRVVRIGNAAIEGAKGALLSRPCRDRIESLVRTIEHVQLEAEPDFFDLFAEMTQLEGIGGGG